VALPISKEIAEASAAGLITDTSESSFSWDMYISLSPKSATRQMSEVKMVQSDGGSPLARFSPFLGDPWNIRLAAIVDPPFNRRRPASHSEAHQIDESLREVQARLGIHAEPVIIIPLGEIVNGTLAQLRAIDEADGEQSAQC